MQPIPDDECLGAGGTIIKHYESGDKVYCLCFNEGRGKTEICDQYFHGVLQLKGTFSYNDNEYDKYPLIKFIQHIESFMEWYKPEIIYTHHEGDDSQDHRVIAHATRIATRPYVFPFIKAVNAYEVLSVRNDTFKPTFYVDIEHELDRKIEWFRKYPTEVMEFPHPRSAAGVALLSGYRGMQCGSVGAEAFQSLYNKSRDKRRE